MVSTIIFHICSRIKNANPKIIGAILQVCYDQFELKTHRNKQCCDLDLKNPGRFSEQTFAVYTTNILLKNNSHVEIIEIFEMLDIKTNSIYAIYANTFHPWKDSMQCLYSQWLVVWKTHLILESCDSNLTVTGKDKKKVVCLFESWKHRKCYLTVILVTVWLIVFNCFFVAFKKNLRCIIQLQLVLASISLLFTEGLKPSIRDQMIVSAVLCLFNLFVFGNRPPSTLGGLGLICTPQNT